MEPQRSVAGDLRSSGASCPEGRAVDRQHLDQGPARGCGRKRGAEAQATGRSRGGRTTKIHGICDGEGRLFRFLLTPGNVADIAAAYALAPMLPAQGCLIGDAGYDAQHLRQDLAFRGTATVIPTNSTRKHQWPINRETCYTKRLEHLPHL
jgi:transposase